MAGCLRTLRVGAGIGLALMAGVRAGDAADSAPNRSGRKYPPRTYETRRLEGRPPVIDGRLDDEAWTQGEWAGGFTQQIPSEGAPPSWPTQLKILHDDRHLYVAFRVHDDPSKVHRYPGRRDAFSGDIVGVCFDSYNDKRTGFEFDLTAGGSKLDLILGNGETEWDTTWDAVWDGEVAHDMQGWTAELRVPFSQLRYGPQERQVWGLHAWRWIDRLQEEDQWQLIPRQNTGRMHQLGELHGVRVPGRGRHLELLPHLVGRASTGPTVAGSASEAAGALGLDAKLGLRSNLTLDATFNPDFGQVEADPSVVNLSAYETFYDEKRPFFLEGRKILSFPVQDQDQLFYSRRVGAAPSIPLPPGDDARLPDRTTILGAVKVTGRTPGGLSVGVLQAFTERERVESGRGLDRRSAVVEPFASFSVLRLHMDWDSGNTSLGGMLTSTHRFADARGRALLPTQATTGGIDFTRYFANRAWVLEARGLVSRVSGDRAAVSALAQGPVHYYQRPDATHLGVDAVGGALSGHGGKLRFGRSDTGRFRVADSFRWYSPGLELNDVGYLRQADLMVHELRAGWFEPRPRGAFRTYSAELQRADEWDFGGKKTRAETRLQAAAQLRNKWELVAGVEHGDVVDTRMLRGGPALRWHEYMEVSVEARTDPSRRVSLFASAERAWAWDDDSRSSGLTGSLSLRPSNRLFLSASASYERLDDHLQYVATAETGAGPRFVLGRLEQDTWSFTVRANLSLTPELTLQYYGSPFVSSGRYAAFKKAAEPRARAYADRFHPYGAEELAFDAGANAYTVQEAREGPRYGFANPDFAFRQFRSNLVARWEWKPGSALYVVWSQGRTSDVPRSDGSLASHWNRLWEAPADHVVLVKLAYWFSP